MTATGRVRVGVGACQAFARRLLEGAGADSAEAGEVAEVVVWNDRVGRNSQGIERLPSYLRRLRAGVLRSPCRLTWERVAPGTERLDGGDGFGQLVAWRAIDRAVELAREFAVGTVAVRSSNHFGTGAYFVARAARQGVLGIALSNGFPTVTAPEGGTPILGNSPIAFAAPRAGADPIVVDLAIGARSGSELRARARLGHPPPEGALVDRDGRPVVEPAAVAGAGKRPFGGAKGFALGIAVEILAGVLTGAAFGSGVASLEHGLDRPSGLGQLLVAIDPDRLGGRGAFYERIELLVDEIRSAPVPEGREPARLPGDLRWEAYHTAECDGLTWERARLGDLEALAGELGVEVPWS